MTTLNEKFACVKNNLDYVNKQVAEGDKVASEMGYAFNLCMDFMEPMASALFEITFNKWYADNKEKLK